MSQTEKPDLEESTNVRVSHRDLDRDAAAAAREMTIRENGLEPISGAVVIVFVLIALIAGGVLFKDQVFNYGDHPYGYRRVEDPNATVKGPPIGEAFDVYFKKGKALFEGNCASCHNSSGGGGGGVPPVAGSEWVSGNNDLYVLAIATNGISGPIMVDGKEYNGVMLALAENWSDYELAALSTYMRNAWGHNSGKVTGLEQVADFRQRAEQRAEAGKSGAVTADELQNEAFWKGSLSGARPANSDKVNKKTGGPES